MVLYFFPFFDNNYGSIGDALKVNIAMSFLVGMHVDQENLHCLAGEMGCRDWVLAIKYTQDALQNNPRRVQLSDILR